jgi:ribonuclease R
MKDRLLAFFRKNPDQKYSYRQLSGLFQIAKEQRKRFSNLLSELIDEEKIAMDAKDRFALRAQSRALRGVIRLNARGFGFVVPEERGKTDVFVPKHRINSAMDGDTVLVESYRNPDDGRFEGRVVQVLERANTVLIGVIHKEGKHTVVRHTDGDTVTELRILADKLSTAKSGDYVAVRITQYPDHEIIGMGEVIRVIGEEFDLSEFTAAVLDQHGVGKDFPGDVRKEMMALGESVDEAILLGRTDLSAMPIITIDGIRAKDFDDAVHVAKKGKGYVLTVAIADVAHYVRTGTALDAEAYRRGTSIYLPDRAIPMLPPRLSDDLCSLKPHVPRLVLVAEMHFDAAGTFQNATFFEAWIRSAKRATYDEVQAYFDGGDTSAFDPDIRTSLDLMKALANLLMKKREARGAVGFDLPEAQVIFDAQGHIARLQRTPRFFSHKLIEECMIAANVAVGELFTARNLPQLYRIHDAPDPAKVSSFIEVAHNMGFGREAKNFEAAQFFEAVAGHPKETYLQMSFLRSLKQAVYDPENRGHYGLMLEDYLHFTSPIRRYPDLIVHRQLKTLCRHAADKRVYLKAGDLNRKSKAAAAHTQLPYNFNDLKAIGRHASQCERDAMELEREILAIYKAYFIRDYIGESFYGRVTRIARFGVFLELEPHFAEGLLGMSALKDDYYEFDDIRVRLIGRRSKRIIGLGDRLWVKVAAVLLETGQVQMVIGEEPKAKAKKKMTTPRKINLGL